MNNLIISLLFLIIHCLLRGEIIQKSARKEFEIARGESDPLIAMKMIMTTRESL